MAIHRIVKCMIKHLLEVNATPWINTRLNIVHTNTIFTIFGDKINKKYIACM